MYPRSRDALSRWLDEAMRLPFVWGERDCATWCADWIYARLGFDPAGPVRGFWHDEASCTAFLEAHGGLGAVASAMAERAGLRTTDTPERGDVGLLAPRILQGGQPLVALAICVGPGQRAPMWAWKCGQEVVFPAMHSAMTWRVGL